MTQGSGRFFRDNAFLVAAVLLPLVVIGFFLLSTAIPRWTVPPPAYDLLLQASDFNTSQTNRVAVEFTARDGRVEATVRPVERGFYGLRSRLFLFDHTTSSVREITVEVPDHLEDGDPPVVIVVNALAGRTVLAAPQAPDGYQLENRSQRGPGLVGELFGMHRYTSDTSLVSRGRVIRIELPAPFKNAYSPQPSHVGWLVPGPTEGQR